MPQDSQKLLWTPSEKRIQNSNIHAFIKFLSENHRLSFSNYQELYSWSIEDSSLFWESLWEFTKIISSQKYSSVLQGDTIRSAVWFENSKLNFAENLLRHKNENNAIIFQTENKEPITITYNALYKKVASVASALKKAGVKKNDRVAAFITNSPETIIAMLATASIGAVWSSCSPDFGYQGVLDRFGQIAPKILFAVNGYSYNGKKHESKKLLEHIAESIPEIEQIISIDSIETKTASSHSKIIQWDNFIDTSAADIIFEQLPFDHPLYIMYSSGTTGKPKCIVHGAGGTLLQHLKELILHTDLKEKDVITYFTTCGWMMWNWLVSSLAVGATIYLYDGSPSYPNLSVLFNAIERHKINIFGTSPKFLSACEARRVKPIQKNSLKSLQTILSTGAPLSHQNFEYVYKNIIQNVQLSSISGGTDIISCFMLGCPTLPVYSGELQCRGLGMKVETYDENNQPVIGQIGELVCTAPFPSRPIYFWNDEDGQKYKEAYFKKSESFWQHGDYIEINKQGGAVIHGRSDATLNSGGVRIGTAEIYGPVEALDEIEDSIVIGKKIGNDTQIILFVVLSENISLTDELKLKIKDTLKTNRSPRHVPYKIFQVTDIPRTISGKKVELAVTKIMHSEEVSNKDALANPKSLEQYKSIFL
ncbi:MAG TPA: acetoacetate--CoA ligase [candidate division Zixibacteria bacterium]|nr:acetoacetate--CoA ligase [candidate division Zixibacteria bacterium]